MHLAGGTLFSVGVAFFAGEALTFAFLAGELIWLSYSTRRALLRDGVRDSGCGLKAFRREAYLELPWFDHIHRFMPAMMLREGWRVETVPVTHRERQGGASKYGVLTRALVGIPDLLGAAWLIRRAGPPHYCVFDAEQEPASSALGRGEIAQQEPQRP